MRELAKDAAATDVTDLLTRYSFDLGGYSLDGLVDTWLNQYPVQWVRLAVIEALYQGRYKAFSVEQILNLWQRRGRSLYRFTHEFERIICGRFPNNPFLHHEAVRTAVPKSSPIKPPLNKPIQPIVPPTQPAEVSPLAKEIPASDHLTEEKGISIWSPVEIAAELSPTNEVESISPVNPVPVEAEEDAELLHAEFDDAELAATMRADMDFLDAELNAEQETEQLDNSADADLCSESQPPDDAELNLSDVDLDSTRPIHEGGPVPTFKPASSADLELLSNGNWSNSIAHQQPIHQFIPTPEPSDFYSKLRAVALQSAPAHQVDISHLTSAEREHR